MASGSTMWFIPCRKAFSASLLDRQSSENTWQQAWDRIFCGYAMPGDGAWNGDTARARADRQFRLQRLQQDFVELEVVRVSQP